MLPDICYSNRLLNIGLQQIETMRIICDIVETFKFCKCPSCLKFSSCVSLATTTATYETNIHH